MFLVLETTALDFKIRSPDYVTKENLSSAIYLNIYFMFTTYISASKKIDMICPSCESPMTVLKTKADN